MDSPFLGTIIAVGFNFAPRGWALCSGQLLPISQNSALFALLGTTYGGDGKTTFGLPDLRGRVAVGMGQSPGSGNVTFGENSGTENVILQIPNLPAHTHPVTSKMSVSDTPATLPQATAGNSLAAIIDVNSDPSKGYTTEAPNVELNAGTINSTIGITGGSSPFSIMQPYLGLNYIIATQGIFPSRD